MEAAEPRRPGQAPVLVRSHWLLLKGPENLADDQAPRLREPARMYLPMAPRLCDHGVVSAFLELLQRWLGGE